MRTTIHGNRWLTQGSRKNSAVIAVRLSAGSNTSLLTATARASALIPSLPPLLEATVTMCRPGTNLLEQGKKDNTVSESLPSTTTSTSVPAGTVVALNTTTCSMHV